MKSTLKILICILFGSVILFLKNMPNLFKSDYCLEDGDCKAGRIIIIDNKEILINKNSCIENNWDWYEKSQYCKIKIQNFIQKKLFMNNVLAIYPIGYKN